MTKLTFVEPSGRRREIIGEPGQSVMRAAKAAGVEGVAALCGGAGMCGTCDSLVVEAPGGLSEMQPTEADTLAFTAQDRHRVRRLICQIVVSPALDGTVFQVVGG